MDIDSSGYGPARRTTAAIVNVRMGSGRLPGKVMRHIGGKPLLQHLLERMSLAKSLDRVVVATSTLLANDAIADLCASLGVACFRGAEDDVLSRTLGALRLAQAEIGVVVFGDGPLIDPAIVDCMVEEFLRLDPACDFVGNDLQTTYPPGMEVEVFSVAALADAERSCSQRDMREHGTLYIRSNPGRYRLLNIEAPAELHRPDLELEVDTEADVPVVEAVLAHFAGQAGFRLIDIIEYLDAHPDLARLNRDVPRRWKAFRNQH